MAQTSLDAGGIGASVRRKEDLRFLTGRGNYVDDINRHGQVYAHILRSPHPHAQIRKIDTTKAKKGAGVIAVFTAADMAADQIGTLPCGWGIKNKDGSPMKEPPHPVLAAEKVRHVGDPLAVVIGESRAAARDAAELIEVDYEALASVTDLAAAVAAGAPAVWEAAPGNVCFTLRIGDAATTEAAFANAARRVRLRLTNPRVTASPMEPRGAIGCFAQADESFTLYS
ncbi:MAG: xanthine dehydrogenase family protein molybdopterin-binding subunit, partial [Alphaproteobacteria bacterium]|nr:xanthine dehydrogenase family protein molybdopterin-binding subunit [Alphaproteobacteria bacterium]